MVFDRVVCGVDSSEAGLAAARIAARVVPPEGSLTLITVEDPSIAVHAGWRATSLAAGLAEDAEAALERGRVEAEALHPAEARVVIGNPFDALRVELERQQATLAVVGIHHERRAVGIALGAVSTYLLHEAPCSVLIAKGVADIDRWPRRIVVGLDGSIESSRAAAAAWELRDRFDAHVRAIAATADDAADLELVRRIAPDFEEHPADAVDALVVASEHADLVVVGSRGLKGLRALGSVSERVAHAAHCPVLVVRTEPAP